MITPANEGILSIEPYTPGLTKEYVSVRYGIPLDRVVKLGSAENPFGPSPKAVDAVATAMSKLDIYPEWTAAALRQKIAAKYGVAAESVFCGAGETELFPLIIRTFAGEGQSVLMHEPCFPIYHQVAQAEGRKPLFVPMGPEFSFNESEYLARLKDGVRIAFLTSPHSPTGKLVDRAFVEAVCRAAPNTVVVMDEAYVHFSREATALDLVHVHPNLIVLRTFSKAFGLAGLRIGFGVAAPEIARLIMVAKPTWNLGQAQIMGAAAALDDDAHVERTTGMIADMRSYVTERIGSLNRFEVIPGSKSNFFLLRITDPGIDSSQAFEGLLHHGIIVKDGSVSFRGLGKRYLRIDVGLRESMDRLVEALAQL